MRVIYKTISETLKNLEVFYLDQSAVNMDGTTIHSGLGIESRTKLLGLHNKYKTTLRKGLSKVKSLIIDELYMVSSDL